MEKSDSKQWMNKLSKMPWLLQRPRIKELVSAYEDLEKLISKMAHQREALQAEHLRKINVFRLVEQLSESKKRIETKLTNTIMLEKKQIASQLSLSLQKRKSR